MTKDNSIRVLYAIHNLNGGGAQRAAIQLVEFLESAQNYESKLWVNAKFGPYLEQYDNAILTSDSDEKNLSSLAKSFLFLTEKVFSRLKLLGIAYKLKNIRLSQINNARINIKQQFDSSQQDKELETILNKCFNPDSIERLKNVIINFKPDIILSSIPESASNIVFTTLASYFPQPRNFLWIAVEQNNTWERCKYYHDTFHQQSIWNKLASMHYQEADHVVAISHGVKSNLVKLYGVEAKKISVIHNAVEVDLVQNQSLDTIDYQKPFIMAIGRFHQQKGFDLLVQAYALVEKNIEADLLILGDGSDQELILNLIQELGIENRVHMPGFSSNPWSYLSKAQYFVLSSRFEGFGNVIVEAMACGCPVVAFDCNYGPAEIIENGQDGILVPAEDITSLAEAMEEVSHNPDLREKLAKNGLVKASKFDVNEMGISYKLLIDNLLKNKYIDTESFKKG